MKKSLTIFVIMVFSMFNVVLANIDTPPNQLGWTSYRLMDLQAYEAKLNEIKQKGHYPVDVEITGGNTRTYSLITRENIENYAWAIHTQLTNDQYNTKWNELKQQGYRPIDQESYTYKGIQYYAGIWIKESTPWASYRNLTTERFNERFVENQKRNYIAIDVDGYVMDGKLYFSGIFVKNTQNLQWSIRRNIPVEDFGDYFTEMSNKGFRIHSNNSYFFNKQQYFATIWVKDNLKWKANRDMTSQTFNNIWNLYRDQGYRLHDVEEYQTALGTRYLGVWVQNNLSLLNWDKQRAVKTLIDQYLSDNPSMGYSVAIAHNGTIRYLRGFGKADQANNVDANSRTVYRLASVSKALTGVMSYILEDRGTINLQRQVRSDLPNLPQHHNYRLEDLLSNRSMVRHYLRDANCNNVNDPVNRLGSVRRAWNATQSFMADSLRTGGCINVVVRGTDTIIWTPSNYHYSTHAYTIMAAAIEARTRQSFCNQLTTLVSDPHGLSSLNCEFLNERVNERAAIYSYNTSNNRYSAVTRDDLSWKYAGGGMESSAYDLVRFGILLNQNRYMTAQRVTHMTNRPDTNANYAFGWDTNDPSEARTWYGKAGDQPGGRAYIRIYPNENIVIVLLGNTIGIGENYRNLTSDIAQVMF